MSDLFPHRERFVPYALKEQLKCDKCERYFSALQNCMGCGGWFCSGCASKSKHGCPG
jgi:formylmethanofuran dehydrogenase subunit E